MTDCAFERSGHTVSTSTAASKLAKPSIPVARSKRIAGLAVANPVPIRRQTPRPSRALRALPL
jgi:hypothetical protein